jgi:hypothetical protein
MGDTFAIITPRGWVITMGDWLLGLAKQGREVCGWGF